MLRTALGSAPGFHSYGGAGHEISGEVGQNEPKILPFLWATPGNFCSLCLKRLILDVHQSTMQSTHSHMTVIHTPKQRLFGVFVGKRISLSLDSIMIKCKSTSTTQRVLFWRLLMVVWYMKPTKQHPLGGPRSTSGVLGLSMGLRLPLTERLSRLTSFEGQSTDRWCFHVF